MLPSNKDFKYMRNAVTAYYPDAITICTLSGVMNAYGQNTVTLSGVSTVKGQLSSPTGTHRLLIDNLRNQGVLNEETYVLHLPYSTNVTIANIIKLTDNTTYDIVHVHPMQTFTAAMELIITRRNVDNHLRTNNDY